MHLKFHFHFSEIIQMSSVDTEPSQQWELFSILLWRGSWFWHFGAIKSPWRSQNQLPFHTIKLDNDVIIKRTFYFDSLVSFSYIYNDLLDKIYLLPQKRKNSQKKCPANLNSHLKSPQRFKGKSSLLKSLPCLPAFILNLNTIFHVCQSI